MTQQQNTIGLLGSLILAVSIFMPYFLFATGLEVIFEIFEESDVNDDYSFDDENEDLEGEDALAVIVFGSALFSIMILPLLNLIIGITGIIRSLNNQGTKWLGTVMLNLYIFIIIILFVAELSFDYVILGFMEIGFWLPLIGSIMMMQNSGSFTKAFIKEQNNDDDDYYEDFYKSIVQKDTSYRRFNANAHNSHEPPFSFQGEVNEDGWEVCEYPRGSGKWWWKDFENQIWCKWES